MGIKKTAEEMIEALAIAVKHGFDGVSEEMRDFKVEVRSIIKKEIKEEMVEVKEKLTGVEDRLTGVEDRLTGVEDRLTGVEKELAKVKFRSSDLDPRVSALEEKMHIVGTKLGFQ